MSNIAVRVEHLSKMYRLGVINNGTLFRDIQTWIALKRGKEDPHSKIGEDKYSGGKDFFWALKDISFDIKQGDRVGIIGKNGAGKSTILKILSRITAPTKGTVKIKGKVASLLEVGTGFHGELTGKENIYLNGAILGMKKRRIDEKMDSIIEFSGIEQHIDTPVKRYSSGMYVRLAFAVAAHLDSDILIADEVLAVGDAEFQKKALGKMQDLSTGEGRTVLFVSHNMASVKKLCNTGLLLDKGKTEFHGGITETINKYIVEHKNVNNYQNDGYIHLDKRENENGECDKVFKKIRFLDKNGISNEKFLMFDPMTIEIDVEGTEKYPNASYVINIYNSDMQKITSYATSRYSSQCVSSPKQIIVEIPSLYLAPDIYHISLFLVDFAPDSYTYTYMDNVIYCAQFCIETSNNYSWSVPVNGLIYPVGRMYSLD